MIAVRDITNVEPGGTKEHLVDTDYIQVHKGVTVTSVNNQGETAEDDTPVDFTIRCLSLNRESIVVQKNDSGDWWIKGGDSA